MLMTVTTLTIINVEIKVNIWWFENLITKWYIIHKWIQESDFRKIPSLYLDCCMTIKLSHCHAIIAREYFQTWIFPDSIPVTVAANEWHDHVIHYVYCYNKKIVVCKNHSRIVEQTVLIMTNSTCLCSLQVSMNNFNFEIL